MWLKIGAKKRLRTGAELLHSVAEGRILEAWAELLANPFANKDSLGDAGRFGQATNRGGFAGSEAQLDGGGGAGTLEYRLSDFLQLVQKVGHIMGIPELGQFLDGVGFWQFA